MGSRRLGPLWLDRLARPQGRRGIRADAERPSQSAGGQYDALSQRWRLTPTRRVNKQQPHNPPDGVPMGCCGATLLRLIMNKSCCKPHRNARRVGGNYDLPSLPSREFGQRAEVRPLRLSPWRRNGCARPRWRGRHRFLGICCLLETAGSQPSRGAGA